MKKMNLRLAIIVLVCWAKFLVAQNGGNDPTFNPSDLGFGKAFGPASQSSPFYADTIGGLAIQPDDKIIISGSFITCDKISRKGIARLNADGSLDPTFNSGTGPDMLIRTISLQSDGKVIIGGDFTSYNGTSINGIARLNTDGSLDPTFNPGTGVNDYVYNSVLQADGKIIIVGRFTTFNGVSRSGIVRINSNGSIDTGFNPGTGTTLTNYQQRVYSLAIQTDGKIIIGGWFDKYNGTSRRSIVRINSNGSIDTGFNPGIGPTIPGSPPGDSLGSVAGINIQADGKIIIDGTFTKYNNISRNNLARLNADGSLDANFNPTLPSPPTTPHVLIQSDGKILVANIGVDNKQIVRFNSNGTVDGSYNSDFLTSFEAHKMAFQSNGKVVILGFMRSPLGFYHPNIFRANINGSEDATFLPSTGAHGIIGRCAIQPDGKIIISGYFGKYNGVRIEGLARLNIDGSLDTTFKYSNTSLTTTAGSDIAIHAICIQPDGKILIGGSFMFFNGITKNGLVRLNTDGTLDSTFTYAFNTGLNTLYAIALQNDGKILIGGYFRWSGSSNSRYIGRLNTDGSRDFSFSYTFSQPIYGIAVENSGRILYISDDGIGRLNSSGTVATPQTAPQFTLNNYYGGFGYRQPIRVLPSGKILVAAGGSLRRFNSDLTEDATFFSDGASDYCIQPDGKILVCRNTIARVDSNGINDASFNQGLAGANDRVYNVDMQTNGKYIIVGGFTSYNGIGRNGIARINSGMLTETELKEENITFKVFPNPLTSASMVQYSLTIPQEVTFELFNIDGKKVYQKNIGYQVSGTHQYMLQLHDLPNGIYFLQSEIQGKSLSQKLLIKD